MPRGCFLTWHFSCSTGYECDAHPQLKLVRTLRGSEAQTAWRDYRALGTPDSTSCPEKCLHHGVWTWGHPQRTRNVCSVDRKSHLPGRSVEARGNAGICCLPSPVSQSAASAPLYALEIFCMGMMPRATTNKTHVFFHCHCLGSFRLSKWVNNYI